MAFMSSLPIVMLHKTRLRCPQISRRRQIGDDLPHFSLLKPTIQATVSEQPEVSKSINTSTEDTFALDAGRDLFFPGMDADMAIQILDAELGSLDAKDDRFIAAERLKFYPSNETVAAMIRFVRRFDLEKMDQYVLEDKVARRKTVESLGRHKGSFRREEVIALLEACLSDQDCYMVEVAVWALAQIDVSGDQKLLESITSVLDNSAVEKRVVIQTLMQAAHLPALPSIRKFVDSPNQVVASAAMAAVAKLSSDLDAMGPVVEILKSQKLIARRAAIEDITLSEYTAAVPQVAVCPNSLVLRSRAVRILLDVIRRDSIGEPELHDKTFILLDKLIWDYPGDLDLLSIQKETKKARDPDRNIKQLYKNDAIYAYAASKCLAEDYRDQESGEVGANVKQSYDDMPYFDYFGAYHVYKTLGWLRYKDGYEMLLDKAQNLPPRFFNHRVGAITALAEIGNTGAIATLQSVARESSLWELKYASMIATERLGDKEVRSLLKNDNDWLIRARARSDLDFGHLRNSFDR